MSATAFTATVISATGAYNRATGHIDNTRSPGGIVDRTYFRPLSTHLISSVAGRQRTLRCRSTYALARQLRSPPSRQEHSATRSCQAIRGVTTDTRRRRRHGERGETA
jgi:hypothetical protein